MSNFILFFVTGLLMVSTGVTAFEDGVPSTRSNNALNLSGYGSLAYTRDNKNNLGFVRELTQDPGDDHTEPFYTDSNLGLQGVYRFNHQYELGGVINLRSKEDDSPKSMVEWA